MAPVVVLVYLLLLLLMLSTTTSAAAEDYTGNITWPGCPARCGEFDIPYPFGIKPGCFHSGLQLTCTNRKLFLGGDHNGTMEVIDIWSNQVTVNVPIFIMPADTNYSYSTYWTPQKGGPYGPYTLSTGNKFNVVGCGIRAFLSDSETGEVLGMCLSVCGGNHSSSLFVGSDLRSGNGYCSVSINWPVPGGPYEIRFDRLLGEGEGEGEGRASGKAFLNNGDYYNFSQQDLISSDLIGGSSVVPLALDWAIRDSSLVDGSSCEEAKKNMSTYVCRSDNSLCTDQYYQGYTCTCSSWDGNDLFNTWDGGNPYISGGCPGTTHTKDCSGPCGNISKNESCSGPCGNTSVPYPFGLGIQCARDKTFVLACNKTTNTTPPLLLLRDKYQVTKIMVEEGQVQAELLSESSIDGSVEFDGSVVFQHFSRSRPTIVLDWVVDYMSCTDALKNNKSSTFPCIYNHSECQDLKNFKNYFTNTYGPAYRCRCSVGYQGNPYTAPGCIDINECNDPEKYKCSGTCINSAGSFECIPSYGFTFDSAKGGTLIGVMVAVGFPLLFMSIRFIYRRWKKRSLKKVREKHFHKNRGLLLQQLISSDNDIAERTRIFSLDELSKATNKFDEARVLGRGGHGTVFKGILSDQRVVAIKKSKINVQSEIDQFLNEIVILSQINHRNVVKLFGCCLETEVPLLVYEFVSNGTLSDHLHHPDRRSSLSWEDRLSIARDSSGALSYLHSAASISIFHRDVKSSNILLDDHCTAKVSDFGTSRSIPFDMTHVVTVVQGTFGYLDPEYYHTGQLTEKSDVYSFGMILVELLTGEEPISFTRPEEERNLCTHFLSALRDGRVSQIVEARVMEEATREEIDTVCRLAEACLRLSGEDRPTMKRVEVSLEGLRRNKTRKRHPWKEPKDEESASLLPSTSSEQQYGIYPDPANSKQMPGGSNSEELTLSITLPR